MTYIALNVNDAEEQRPAPKGKYELQITGVVVGQTGEQSKNPGCPTYKVSLGFTDLSLNAPNISHWVTLFNENDSAESTAFKKLLFKRFLSAFNVYVSDEGFDVDQLAMELVGQTANLEVGLSPPNDNGDVYNNVVFPKLKEEQVGGKGTPPRRRG